MNLTITCPSCQRTLRVPENLLGQQLKCPSCAHVFTTPAQVEEETPPRPASGRHSRRPSPQPMEDYNEAPSHSRRNRRGGVSRCPYCESTFPPLMKKKVSPVGWIVFAAILALSLGMCVAGVCFLPFLIVAFVCVPLSILGVLITTEERVCGECGAKLGK